MGKPFTLKTSFVIPIMQITYKRANSQDIYTMNLKGVTTATGDWAVLVKNKNGKIVDLCKKTFHQQTNYTCAVKQLATESYKLQFLFSGTFGNENNSYAYTEKANFVVSNNHTSGKISYYRAERFANVDQVNKLIEDAKKEEEQPISTTIIGVGVFVLVGCLWWVSWFRRKRRS